MIFVERTEPSPASLKNASSLAQAAAADVHYGPGWHSGKPAFEFTRYKEIDVQFSLRKMFSWKCAYCERQLEKGAFEVEHYRPKGGVNGCDHPGYWWLALEWTNLLPTCAACNKALLQHVVTADMDVATVEAMQGTKAKDLHGKAMQFPVTNDRLTAKSHDHFAEGPLLIDPTRVDPEPELSWRSDCEFSVVEAAGGPCAPSACGEATIRCVALNRIDLVENRTQILERLRTQRIQILDTLERRAGPGSPPDLIASAIETAIFRLKDMEFAAHPSQPYSAMVRSFVRTFASEFKAWAAQRGFDVS